MSTKALLRAIKIFNSHDISRVGAAKCYIGRAYSGTRELYPHGWHVIGIGFNTDPSAHWTNYGRKWFSTGVCAKANEKGTDLEGLNAAKAWASENYGITEWVRSPLSRTEWVSKDALVKVMAMAKEQAKATPSLE